METKVVYIPYKLADIALSEGWERNLAFYCQFLSMNGRKIIYSYSHTKMAYRLGISRQTVSRHVQFLISKGLLFIKDGHLQSIPKSALYDWLYSQDGNPTGSGRIKVRVHASLTQTEYNISFRKVDQKLKQQNWHINNRVRDKEILMKVRDNARMSSSEVKRYSKIMDKKKNIGKNIIGTDCKYMSDSFISRLLNISITTARRMLSYWSRMGLTKTLFIKGRIVQKGVEMRAYSYMVATSHEDAIDTYFYKGSIVKIDRREIEFGDVLQSEQQENIKNKEEKAKIDTVKLFKLARIEQDRRAIDSSSKVMSIVQ